MAGSLYIVAAPSGAGKSTLVNALLQREHGIRLSVSYTTRTPRPGEVDGQHYHFVSHDAFMDMAERGQFFEYAIVHGDLKGTARSAVESELASGVDVLLEIDYQGARLVRHLMPEAISIFILPPSRLELERRLRSRAQDSEDVIQRRLAGSRTEIAHVHEFDYIIVNDDFERALADMVTIVQASRLRQRVQTERLKALLSGLIA
ncbi:MAG: guanylate kinase [Lysobacterales bacterium CG02_land_8_20_14_3_00_62_12]|nr:MAG: guanylate kinase [Xanthomonadales bacterium CG02_land_8_20_14_3_00_62_12]PJA43241.1 MAG: guanylate kinase [Xanthomonadales bacterium CG_4_9_14_3_um_filter_62_6]